MLTALTVVYGQRLLILHRRALTSCGDMQTHHVAKTHTFLAVETLIALLQPFQSSTWCCPRSRRTATRSSCRSKQNMFSRTSSQSHKSDKAPNRIVFNFHVPSPSLKGN